MVFRAEPVCSQEGTLFCPTNSARSGNTDDAILSMFDIDAFDACFPNALTRLAYPKAEILVRDALSLVHAESIVFCDEEARDYWLPKLRQAEIPPEVRSQMRTLTVTVRQFDGFGFPNDYVIERRVRE